MFITKRIPLVALTVLVLITLIGPSAVMAEWVEPTTTPPEGNPPSPIHTGDQYQEKAGVFKVFGLITRALDIFISGTYPGSVLKIRENATQFPSYDDYAVSIATYGSKVGEGNGRKGGLIVQAGWDNTTSTIAQFSALETGYGEVPRMTILSSGRVGIGTTTPDTQISYTDPNTGDAKTGSVLLHVTEWIKAKGLKADDIIVDNLTVNDNFYFEDYLLGFWKKVSPESPHIYYDEGNVGIGTDNPGDLLDIQSRQGNTGGLTLRNDVYWSQEPNSPYISVYMDSGIQRTFSSITEALNIDTWEENYPEIESLQRCYCNESDGAFNCSSGSVSETNLGNTLWNTLRSERGTEDPYNTYRSGHVCVDVEKYTIPNVSGEYFRVRSYLYDVTYNPGLGGNIKVATPFSGINLQRQKGQNEMLPIDLDGKITMGQYGMNFSINNSPGMQLLLGGNALFDGNVGIGITNPKTKLDVAGTTFLRAAPSHDQIREQLRFGRYNNDIRYHSIFSQHGGGSNSWLQFRIHDGGASPYTAQRTLMEMRGDRETVTIFSNPSVAHKGGLVLVNTTSRGDNINGFLFSSAFPGNPELRIARYEVSSGATSTVMTIRGNKVMRLSGDHTQNITHGDDVITKGYLDTTVSDIRSKWSGEPDPDTDSYNIYFNPQDYPVNHSIAVGATNSNSARIGAEGLNRLFSGRSGRIDARAEIVLGRTSNDMVLGVVGGGNEYFAETLAGDIILRQENSNRKIYFGVSGNPSSLTVTSNRVGVGTNTPTSKLHISDNSGGGSTANFIVAQDGNSGNYTGHWKLGDPAMILGHNSGARDIGLQIANETRLEVNRAGYTFIRAVDGTNPGEQLRIGRIPHNTLGDIRYHSLYGGHGSGNGSYLQFNIHDGANSEPYTNQNNVLKLLGSGRVEIGGGRFIVNATPATGYTTFWNMDDAGVKLGNNSNIRNIEFVLGNNPNRKLLSIATINQGGYTAVTAATTSSWYGEQLRFGRHDNDIRYHSIYTKHASDADSFLQFKIHDGGVAPYLTQSTVMTLKGHNGGRVGIGTETPAARLNVDGQVLVDEGPVRVVNKRYPTDGTTWSWSWVKFYYNYLQNELPLDTVVCNNVLYQTGLGESFKDGVDVINFMRTNEVVGTKCRQFAYTGEDEADIYWVYEVTRTNVSGVPYYYSGSPKLALRDQRYINPAAIELSDNRLKIGREGGAGLVIMQESGRVGVGTHSPSTRLHINDGVGNFTFSASAVGSGYTSQFMMDDTGLNINTNSPIRGINLRSLTSLQMATGPQTNIEQLRIGRSDLVGGVPIRYHSIYGGHSTEGNSWLQFRIHDGGGAPYTAQRTVLTLSGGLGNGRVGINTDSPKTALHISDNSGGDSTAHFIVAQDGNSGNYTGHWKLGDPAMILGHNSGARDIGLQIANETRLEVNRAGYTFIRAVDGTNPGEQLRIGRIPHNTLGDIRYHSIFSQHGGGSNSWLQFRIHDGGASPHTAQKTLMEMRGDRETVTIFSSPSDAHKGGLVLTNTTARTNETRGYLISSAYPSAPEFRIARYNIGTGNADPVLTISRLGVVSLSSNHTSRISGDHDVVTKGYLGTSDGTAPKFKTQWSDWLTVDLLKNFSNEFTYSNLCPTDAPYLVSCSMQTRGKWGNQYFGGCQPMHPTYPRGFRIWIYNNAAVEVVRTFRVNAVCTNISME